MNKNKFFFETDCILHGLRLANFLNSNQIYFQDAEFKKLDMFLKRWFVSVAKERKQIKFRNLLNFLEDNTDRVIAGARIIDGGINNDK